MSLAENKERCLQMVAAWNRWDISGVIKYWSPDVVHYSEGDQPVSSEEMIRRMEGGLRAFPDLHLDVKSILAEEDLVSLRITVTATHKGEFQDLAPTGRQVTWHIVEELRFNDEGEVIEHYDVMNYMPMLRELGKVPAGV